MTIYRKYSGQETQTQQVQQQERQNYRSYWSRFRDLFRGNRVGGDNTETTRDGRRPTENIPQDRSDQMTQN